jgi:hypothetical protein
MVATGKENGGSPAVSGFGLFVSSGKGVCVECGMWNVGIWIIMVSGTGMCMSRVDEEEEVER